MKEEVILVDTNDLQIGTMEKLEAHEKALLHRAFSVFIFNERNQLLLQQRALTKYHSAGLWTNTCCSHPRSGEDTLKAAQRRLMEEMGMNVELVHKTSFVYKASFDNGLTEYEFDHVYVGVTNNNPVINTNEVNSYRWETVETIKKEIQLTPENFTVWFKIALEKVF